MAAFLFYVATHEQKFLPPHFKAFEIKDSHEPDANDLDPAQDEFSQTANTDSSKQHKTDIKINIAEVMKLKTQGVNANDLEGSLQELASYGDEVFKVISDDLFKGNSEITAKEEIGQRMSEIDFLGFAANSNEQAKKVLKEFATSELDFTKTERVVHMDLADRLEAFSYLTRTDEAVAVNFVRSLTDNGLKREYIYTMFIGYKMTGLDSAAAVEVLYAKIKK